MKEVRSFAAARPGPLAVGADGRVWVIEGTPAPEPYLSFYTDGTKVVSYNAKGEVSTEVTDFEDPCALAVNAQGRLLVGGLNKHCQVWIYDVKVRTSALCDPTSTVSGGAAVALIRTTPST